MSRADVIIVAGLAIALGGCWSIECDSFQQWSDGLCGETEPGGTDGVQEVDLCGTVALSVGHVGWDAWNAFPYTTVDPLPSPIDVLATLDSADVMRATSHGAGWEWEWDAAPTLGHAARLMPWKMNPSEGTVLFIRDLDGYHLPVPFEHMPEYEPYTSIPWVMVYSESQPEVEFLHYSPGSTRHFDVGYLDLGQNVWVVHTLKGIYRVEDETDEQVRFWLSSVPYMGFVTESDPVLSGAVFDEEYPMLNFTTEITHNGGKGFYPLLGRCRMREPDQGLDSTG